MLPSLSKEIENAQPDEDTLMLWWLGQAGFALKTHAGQTLLVDPYLSDSCERLHGFKRLSLPAITPAEARTDWVFLTHEHTDHLDPDTLEVIARTCPQCRFAGPADCREALAALGVSADRFTLLEPGKPLQTPAFSVHPEPADHGDYATSALMLLIESEGVRVLFSGDTSLRPGLVQPITEPRVDVLLPCINGGFGNMNHIDAARLAQTVKPRYAIPCHFWTLAEQGGGDPWGFIHACHFLCPEVTPILLRPGEPFVVEAQ